jgi:hypothetical protein
VQLLERLRPTLPAPADLPAWVPHLCQAVHDGLGGKLSEEQVAKCRAEAARFTSKQVDIGHFLELRLGVCRHRAYLLHHLAEALGLQVLTHRGTVPNGRHAWNEIRIDGKRIFVDSMLNLVLGDARRAEHACGYEASRVVSLAPEDREDRSMVAVLGEVETPSSEFRLDYEVRKAPSGEEVVMLIYPQSDMLQTRFLYTHVRVKDADKAPSSPLFDLQSPLSHRIYVIIGDFADHLMDSVDAQELAGLHDELTACKKRIGEIGRLVDR